MFKPTDDQVAIIVAMEDFEFSGVAIQKGQVVANVLGAVNRDPGSFLNPAGFDVGHLDGYTGNLHLAFGNGVHLCLGAPLVRLECKIALASILRWMPSLQQVDKSEAQRYTFV